MGKCEGRLAGLVSITDITERKQAVEALRQSEERYRTVLEEMEDAYFEVDLGGHLTFVNNSVCRDLGYSKEELMGMSYKNFSAEDDIESVFRVFNEVYRTGMPNKGFSWKTTRKDGSHGFAETSVSPIRNNKGEIIGFSGVGRDVTERKQTEEKLRQSEENYRVLFDSSVIGTVVLDAETMKVVMVNRAALKMFGFSSAEEVFEAEPFDFILPEDRESYLETTKTAVLEQNSHESYQIRAVTRDGREIWINTTAAKIMHKDRLAGLISFTDVTERKQAEEALRQSEENYRALFDSAVIGTIVLDAENMKVVIANKAAAKIFGFSSVEGVLEADPLDFIRPEDRERVSELAEKALFEQDSQLIYELGAVTKDGKEIWISATGARIIHEGRLAGLVSFTDITEKRQQNDRLIMADRLASIGELAAGTAHELNNPLTSVIGFAQLLMEKDTPDYIRRDLAFIKSEAQRAITVTSNLLTFARKYVPEKQLNQINEVIEGILQLRAYAHKSNGIEIERHLAPNLPEIMVDYFQMQQVFLNIIINAEYFMTEAHKMGTLTITTKKQNNTVRISFADDGPGIPPEDLSRIFDPFFTSKEPGKGTGLGLSICHGIVAEHGGQIYAKSQPGKGATILVELPINGSDHIRSVP
jgi:PAS domain S-box-containing protein